MRAQSSYESRLALLTIFIVICHNQNRDIITCAEQKLNSSVTRLFFRVRDKSLGTRLCCCHDSTSDFALVWISNFIPHSPPRPPTLSRWGLVSRTIPCNHCEKEGLVNVRTASSKILARPIRHGAGLLCYHSNLRYIAQSVISRL